MVGSIYKDPYIYIIPLGISFKECDNPGCRKKRFFFAKIGGLCTWLTRTPRLLRRPPWPAFFRESILRGYRHAFRFLQIVKTRVVRRPSRASQMGCCMFLCMLTGSRLTWTSLFFSDLHITYVFDLYFLYFYVSFCIWFPGQWFFRGP